MGKTVHVYTNDSWSRLTAPGGKILELTTDSKNLFALVGEPMETTHIKKYNGQTWDEVAHGSFETIAGAGGGTTGIVFAATKTDVSAYDDAGNLKETMSPGSLLMGAAYLADTYYLAIAEEGIYTYDGTNFSSSAVGAPAATPVGTDPAPTDPPAGGSIGKNTVGVFIVKDEVVAVTRNGEILRGNSNGFTIALSSGYYFTGAMGLWKNGADQLLLIGLQGSTLSALGYREVKLTADGALSQDRESDGSLKKLSLLKPGSHASSTVSNEDKYDSTIGIRVVTSIAQAGDGTPFAATAKNGLWSYRIRDGAYVWNAEE
jgi:hypothetical protein